MIKVIATFEIHQVTKRTTRLFDDLVYKLKFDAKFTNNLPNGVQLQISGKFKDLPKATRLFTKYFNKTHTGTIDTIIVTHIEDK